MRARPSRHSRIKFVIGLGVSDRKSQEALQKDGSVTISYSFLFSGQYFSITGS